MKAVHGAAMMKPFDIFRPGRHTSNQGTTLEFSDDTLKAIADAYDPALHEAPIVVGHPKTDDPAYGWIAALSVQGGRLIASPAKVDAAFSDLVKDGKYSKRSAAFYPPHAPNNPTPGQYYLRHVGFLGAQAPAVKGLRPVEFGDDTVVLEFEDVEFAADWRTGWALQTCARLFRGLRDWIIETRDVETADKLLPSWEVDELNRQAIEARAESDAALKPAFSDTAPDKKDETMTEQNKAAEDRLAEIEKRERELAGREASFAEAAAKTRAEADAAFVETVVKAGRLPIGLQATATALFSELDDEELTFADGRETKKTSPRAAFRDLLEKLPVPVVTGELASGEGVDFADYNAVAGALVTEMETAKAKGETISPAEAQARLKNKAA